MTSKVFEIAESLLLLLMATSRPAESKFPRGDVQADPSAASPGRARDTAKVNSNILLDERTRQQHAPNRATATRNNTDDTKGQRETFPSGKPMNKLMYQSWIALATGGRVPEGQSLVARDVPPAHKNCESRLAQRRIPPLWPERVRNGRVQVP